MLPRRRSLYNLNQRVISFSVGIRRLLVGFATREHREHRAN
jgi:hypothetical protein